MVRSVFLGYRGCSYGASCGRSRCSRHTTIACLSLVCGSSLSVIARHYPSLHVIIRHPFMFNLYLACPPCIVTIVCLNVTIHHRLDIFVFAFHAVCFTSILRHVIVGRSPGVHGVHILDATRNAWGPAGVVIPTAGLVGRSRGIAYL